GAPEDLWECVARGIDLFDCVLPARVARHGGLYTPAGRINMRNAAYRDLHGPFDPACACPTCRRFTAAYLHHLFRTGELLWFRLATMHNLWFVLRQMETMRAAILDGSFDEQRAAFHARYQPANRSRASEERALFLQSRAGRVH